MHSTKIKLIAFTVLIFFSMSSFSEDLSSDRLRQLEIYIKEKNANNFTNWNGIAFHCSGNNQSNHDFYEICKRVETSSSFLAALDKINLKKVNNPTDLLKEFYFNNKLLLEVRLYGTKNGSPSAIHSQLLAYVPNGSATTSKLSKQEHADVMRKGDLILWENTATSASSGTRKSLISPMSEATEQLLKQFLSDYLNAQESSVK